MIPGRLSYSIWAAAGVALTAIFSVCRFCCVSRRFNHRRLDRGRFACSRWRRLRYESGEDICEGDCAGFGVGVLRVLFR
jgi:hypothetical protein